MHYLPQGDESSPGGSWGICAPALPEVLTYIKVVPMKSRSASEWVKAYYSIHQELTVKGFKPNLQTLDNEASTALKNFFTANYTAYQLVPPHCHRRNTAERAIRTFKEHFVAGIS
jgi:hypothetical protein